MLMKLKGGKSKVLTLSCEALQVSVDETIIRNPTTTEVAFPPTIFS